MSEWRPIETIPNDDKLVLLYLSGGDMCLAPGHLPVNLSKNQTKAMLKATGTWPDHLKYTATHWMPLPDPPTE